MRRWLLPLLAGIVVALVAYQGALIATPRFLMAAAIKRVGTGGMNRMTHGPLATDKAQTIVRPSPDLAYSSCPFDLSNGPVRVHVAAIPTAYWSLSVFDERTDAAFVRNNQEATGGALDIVIARKGQPTPPGATVVTVEGAKGIALVRALVEDRAGFAPIDAARRQSSCATL